MEKNWYNKSKEEVFKEFGISENTGLSDEQVIKNREKYGAAKRGEDAKNRAKTFSGIARAMAEQWAGKAQ